MRILFIFFCFTFLPIPPQSPSWHRQSRFWHRHPRVNFNLAHPGNPRHIKVDKFTCAVRDSNAVLGKSLTTSAPSTPFPPSESWILECRVFCAKTKKKLPKRKQDSDGGEGAAGATRQNEKQDTYRGNGVPGAKVVRIFPENKQKIAYINASKMRLSTLICRGLHHTGFRGPGSGVKKNAGFERGDTAAQTRPPVLKGADPQLPCVFRTAKY